MLTFVDREEALREDPYYSSNYTYDDDDDEWDDDEGKWEAADEEPTVEEEPTEAKEESNAYLEFLHDEVSILQVKLATLTGYRLKSLAALSMTMTMTSSVKTAFFSSRHSTRLSLISSSVLP